MQKPVFTPDEMSLLAAIHANPRNDGHRFAYADWLEKQGELEHAEFIRLQCQQPYIALSTRDPTQPHKSFSYDFPRDDPTANDRLNRLITLFPIVYRSARYERQRTLHYYEEHVYGLPLIQVEVRGDCLNEGNILLAEIGHLSRIDLSLHTLRLADWLKQPLMTRVDKLQIWPHIPIGAELDEHFALNSHHDAFWADNIRLLAASPVIAHLDEVNPCGCLSTGALTAQSVQNLALCRELLEPRVYVNYSY